MAVPLETHAQKWNSFVLSIFWAMKVWNQSKIIAKMKVQYDDACLLLQQVYDRSRKFWNSLNSVSDSHHPCQACWAGKRVDCGSWMHCDGKSLIETNKQNNQMTEHCCICMHISRGAVTFSLQPWHHVACWFHAYTWKTFLTSLVMKLSAYTMIGKCLEAVLRFLFRSPSYQMQFSFPFLYFFLSMLNYQYKISIKM